MSSETGSGAAPETLKSGDLVRLTFSGGDSSLEGRVITSTSIRYTFEYGGSTVNIGTVPYTYSEVGAAVNMDSTPTTLDPTGAVRSINETIDANPTLKSLVSKTDLTNMEKRFVTALVNENTIGVTISFDGDFFLVESANLVATNGRGTFTERGALVLFNGGSASLGGGDVVYVEDCEVEFVIAP